MAYAIDNRRDFLEVPKGARLTIRYRYQNDVLTKFAAYDHCEVMEQGGDDVACVFGWLDGEDRNVVSGQLVLFEPAWVVELQVHGIADAPYSLGVTEIIVDPGAGGAPDVRWYPGSADEDE